MLSTRGEEIKIKSLPPGGSQAGREDRCFSRVSTLGTEDGPTHRPPPDHTVVRLHSTYI